MTDRRRLTKTLVDGLREPGTTWDSEITGFHVRVLGTGRKIYGLKYRDRSSRQRWPKIGVHGQITAEQARGIAREWIVKIAAGDSPGVATGGGETVKALSIRYMKEYAEIYKKAGSVALDEIYWRVHILPVIGHLSIKAVTGDDVRRIQTILKRQPVTANRVRALMHKAFELAEKWILRPRATNPAKEVDKLPEPKAKHRYLAPAALAKLGAALRLFEAAGGSLEIPTHRMTSKQKEAHARALAAGAARKRFAALIMLLLITGCRKNEWMAGRWAWVGLNSGLYELPDSKTGAKTVLLSPPAVAILNVLHAIRDKNSPFIFPGKTPDKPLQEERAQWKALLKLAGLPENIRIHDLRHSFASAAKSSGFDRGIVADLLHHSDEAVTDIYADLFNDVVRGAQNKTADNLIGWLGGPKAE